MNVFRVWVVEMLVDTSRGMEWQPCAEAKLTKGAAKEAAREWKARNLPDRFRVAEYRRAP